MLALEIILSLVFGAAIGSFLNVVILRLPAGDLWAAGRIVRIAAIA